MIEPAPYEGNFLTKLELTDVSEFVEQGAKLP